MKEKVENDNLLEFEDKSFDKVKKVSRSKAIKLTKSSFSNFKKNVKEKISLEKRLENEIDKYNENVKEINSMAHIEDKGIKSDFTVDDIETEIAELKNHGIKIIELNEKMRRVSFYKDAMSKPIKLKDKFIFALKNKKALFDFYKKSANDVKDNVSEYSEKIDSIQGDLFNSIKNKNGVKVDSNLEKLFDAKDKYFPQDFYSVDDFIKSEKTEEKDDEKVTENKDAAIVSDETDSKEVKDGNVENGLDENKDKLVTDDNVVLEKSVNIGDSSNISNDAALGDKKVIEESDKKSDIDISSNSDEKIARQKRLNNILHGETSKLFDVNAVKKGNDSESIEKVNLDDEIVDNSPVNETNTGTDVNVNIQKDLLNKEDEYRNLHSVLNQVLDNKQKLENNNDPVLNDKNVDEGVKNLSNLEDVIDNKKKETYNSINGIEPNIDILRKNQMDNETLKLLSLNELKELYTELGKQLELVDSQIKERKYQEEVEDNKYAVDNFHDGFDVDQIGHYSENNDFSDYFSKPETMEKIRTFKIEKDSCLADDFNALKELLSEGYKPDEVRTLSMSDKEDIDFSEEIDRIVKAGIKK